MKKILVLTLALVLMLCCFTACNSNDANGDDTAEDRTFVVGFDAEFPPFGFIDENGDYDGFDLAIAEEVCNRLGWTFEAQAIDWNSKDAELNLSLIHI